MHREQGNYKDSLEAATRAQNAAPTRAFLCKAVTGLNENKEMTGLQRAEYVRGVWLDFDELIKSSSNARNVSRQQSTSLIARNTNFSNYAACSIEQSRYTPPLFRYKQKQKQMFSVARHLPINPPLLPALLASIVRPTSSLNTSALCIACAGSRRTESRGRMGNPHCYPTAGGNPSLAIGQ